MKGHGRSKQYAWIYVIRNQSSETYIENNYALTGLTLWCNRIGKQVRIKLVGTWGAERIAWNEKTRSSSSYTAASTSRICKDLSAVCSKRGHFSRVKYNAWCLCSEKEEKNLLSEILFIQSMVSELVKDLQRSSLNYPRNGGSAELLKSIISNLKSRLQLTRKLAQLATICLELEPGGNGNEQRNLQDI